MVVGAVHGRPHQVGGAGVHADVLLVDVLFVDGPGHQMAIGPQHEPAQLRTDGHVAHPGGYQDLLIGPPHPFADGGDVVGGLLRPVGDAHAAGEVDEGDVGAGLRLQLHSQLEQDAGQGGVVVVGEGVGRQEGVDAELLGPHGRQTGEGLRDLLPGHAVLGVAGVVHHLEALPGLSQGEHAAGIIAAADLLRHMADGLLQIVYQGQVVQIDDGPQPVRQLELLRRRVIGGEHDLLSGDAALFRHHQLRQGGAVAAAALLVEDLQNGGRGGGLDGEVLPVAGVPGEGSPQAAGVFPDAPLVVDVEGRGVSGGDGLQLLFGDKGCFHGNDLGSSQNHRAGRGRVDVSYFTSNSMALSRNLHQKPENRQDFRIGLPGRCSSEKTTLAFVLPRRYNREEISRLPGGGRRPI